MRKYAVIMLSLIPVLVFGQSLPDQMSAHPWTGSGILMGSPATFEMHWRWELGKRFLKLEFQNKRETADGKEIVFKAHAYYKAVGDSLYEGTWFDSRGVTFPLRGVVRHNEFIVEWGSEETELGRTVYTVQSPGEMKVTDFIFRDDRHIKFGEAAYRKK